MRLETNVIGNIDDPDGEDIARAFENREDWDWADVAGNLFALYRDDNKSIHSVSGDNFQNFSLTICDKPDSYLDCTHPLTRDEVQNFFIRFANGDDTWNVDLQWERRMHESVFRKLLKFLKRN